MRLWALWKRHQVFVRWAVTVALAVYAVSIASDVADNQEKLKANQVVLTRNVKANCQVVAVLLENRANRKKTTRLFVSIRANDPVLFDRLVKRAERGDRKLRRVQGDLACDVK